ncbi:FMN-binding glutamate synthase family protein [Candidatus Woesearchaeota archaeon]|nr:FMN-binding glutamate synthase family protein [Candidatus Woesearchaeota archaeon]
MEKWVLDIKKRAQTGKAPVSSGRSNKIGKISFNDLIFIPAQLAKKPVDYFKEKISSETIIGKLSKHPLKLKTPILIAAMSFGALSKEAKIALAKGAAIAGTAANTGEGGMLPEERKQADILIAQYSTGRFGVNEEYLKTADAIEVKIGQGAKPGQGGLLPSEKVTKEVSKIRKVPLDKDIHSPAYHIDIKNIKDLKKKVEWLRKLTNGKPIIIKLGAGDIEKDVELAVQANPDAIAIDGMSGGTGAAPEIMLHDFGTPTLSAVVKARKTLDKLKAKQELLIGGGLNKGADVAKALALGADAVFIGFPMLTAMGCVYCKQCYKGKCPLGVTTQDSELRKKFPKNAAEGVANYIKACTEEVKMAAGACGHDNIHKLNKKDLQALSKLISEIANVPLA